MNRLQFISTLKSVLLYIPLANYLKINKLNDLEFDNASETSSIIFPDRENYLTAAVCVFATPGWGDGKNGDDSYVDVIVNIECYDNLYSAKGSFRNGTEIESNVVRDMPIIFDPKDSKKIFYDGINNVNILILGSKRNKDEATNDQWNVRWEFVLNFKKGNTLSTGGSDPAIEYHFAVQQTQINVPNVHPGSVTSFKKGQFFNERKMKVGDPIG